MLNWEICRYDVCFAVIVLAANSFWPIHFRLASEQRIHMCECFCFFFAGMSLLPLNWIKSTISKSLDSCMVEVPLPIPAASLFFLHRLFHEYPFMLFHTFFFTFCTVVVVDFFFYSRYHYLRFFAVPFILCFTLFWHPQPIVPIASDQIAFFRVPLKSTYF